MMLTEAMGMQDLSWEYRKSKQVGKQNPRCGVTTKQKLHCTFWSPGTIRPYSWKLSAVCDDSWVPQIGLTCISAISGYVIAQAAATEPKHGIQLLKPFNCILNVLGTHSSVIRQHLKHFIHIAIRKELVEGRVQQANCHWQSIHGLE